MDTTARPKGVRYSEVSLYLDILFKTSHTQLYSQLA